MRKGYPCRSKFLVQNGSKRTKIAAISITILCDLRQVAPDRQQPTLGSGPFRGQPRSRR